MKKRIFSMLLALIMALGLIPVNAFAAGKTVSQYFDGLPVTANPGTGTRHGRSAPRMARRSCFPAAPERAAPPAP